MMQKATKFFTSLFCCVMLSLSCCKGPVELDYKNPREYTWTATMLAYPGSGQTKMYSIWGTSPSNVYASGFSFLGGTQGALYHYNGTQWSPVTALPSPDYNNLWEITGFAANDIWIAAQRFYTKPEGGTLDSAAVLHFNGGAWTQVLPSHMRVKGLKSMWGNSPQNLFFGSQDGKVIRYDGNLWEVDTLYPGLSVETIGGDEERVFTMGNTYRGAIDDSVMCFSQTSNTWQLIDTQLLPQHLNVARFGLGSVYSPATGVYYSSGFSGVFRWEEDQWINVFNPVADLLGMGGTGTMNIFAVGVNNDGPAVYHWDGASWNEIILPEGLVPDDVILYNVWTNGKEAFIVGNNGAVSYVLHGK